jgi:CO/xanthine dehydrogenase Mo-binding subunit
MNTSTLTKPTRRSFLKTGSLTIAFSLSPLLPLSAQTPPARAVLPGSLNNNRMLDGWLRIHPDGKVTVFTGKIELGQGILTALSQIVSDELDVDLKRLSIISGDTSQTPNEGVTAGSLSIQDSGTALRFACAEARGLLLQAAAAKLSVAESDLRVSDGTITASNGASSSYWALTSDTLLKREASAKTTFKPSSQHKMIGQSLQRRDIPAKVTGGAAYVQDMRLPGMLFGRVVRPAAPRAKLLSVDEAAVKAMPGVVAIVRDGNFLAVAAQREEQAIAAARALQTSAKWESPGDLPPSGAALFPFLKKQSAQTTVVNEKKDAAAAGTATRKLAATYTRPYQAHASIGPSCAVAQWDKDKLQVWTHSQGVFPLRGDLAKALRISDDKITVMHREGSGCYGQNGADDVALDAALMARGVPGKPVKLQWMREDEFGWEPQGSPMNIELKASLDASGKIVEWEHELWSYTHSTRPYDPEGVNLTAAWHIKDPLPRGPSRNIPQPSGGSDRNSIPLYVIPQQKVTNHLLLDQPIRTSALRTLGAYANIFALESFMDELAAAAGADPVEFRLRHLSDPRAKAVIERTAAMAKWQSQSGGAKPAGSGLLKGRGIGFSKYKNLAVYCAVIADVVVDTATGIVRVERTWSAADAGLVINPDGFKNQIEGGIVQSSSWTLMESMQNDANRVITRTWTDYPILRFPEVPTVQVELINRPDERPLGVGEGSQGPTVAAIANAFANATGKRLRDLPFTPEHVKQVLA